VGPNLGQYGRVVVGLEIAPIGVKIDYRSREGAGVGGRIERKKDERERASELAIGVV